MAQSSVKVALRVRPLTAKEYLENCTECISYVENEPQVIIGTDRSFTFDLVFDPNRTQEDVYQSIPSELVGKFLDGYNCTILAYGQTGSGKTYTMGTGLDMRQDDSEFLGIVPRAIQEIFKSIEEKDPNLFKYEVYTSFLELYNEELVDLLNPQTQQHRGDNAKRSNTAPLHIREDGQGGIFLIGVKYEKAESPEDLLMQLQKGSLCRTTGSTDMNVSSSRSHAIFSITLHQARLQVDDKENSNKGQWEKYISKFHFVDLAGSERLKRTNASGERAREGIAINSGLLALGNVISALGDESKKGAHVPYRDSKLTRLLQDSLGGNSQTLMLACVSASDSNFMETLNTLKYANRARNIKNKVHLNQDFAGKSLEISQLKTQVAKLKLELEQAQESRQLLNPDYNSKEVKELRQKCLELEKELEKLKMLLESAERRMKLLESELMEFRVERDISNLKKTAWEESASGPSDNELDSSNNSRSFTQIVTSYQQTIMDLECRVFESQQQVILLKEEIHNMKKVAPYSLSTRSIADSKHADTKSLSFKNCAEQLEKTKHKFSNELKSILSKTTDIDKPSDDLEETELLKILKKNSKLCKKLDGSLNTKLEKTLEPMDDFGDDEGENNSESDFVSTIEKIGKDILYQEELINHLESGQREYDIMKTKYEQKLKELQQSMEIIQKERDLALKKLTTNEKSKEATDLRSKYEGRIKRLLSELSEVKRKYFESTQAAASSRSQHDQLIKKMKHSIQSLKDEKSRMIVQMKEELEKMKVSEANNRREMMLLKKKERKAVELAKKLEKNNEVQRMILKRRFDETKSGSGSSSQSNSKLKSVMNLLKRTSSPKISKVTRSLSGCSPPLKRKNWTITSMSANSGNNMNSPVFKLLAAEANVVNPPSAVTGSQLKNQSLSPSPSKDQISQLDFKKHLFQKELDHCVNIRHLQLNMEGLLEKRERLYEEQQALQIERSKIKEALIEKGEDPEPTGEDSPYYMDDRLDSIDDEIKYYNNKIRQLQSEIAEFDVHGEDTSDSTFATSTHLENLLHLVRSLRGPFELTKMCEFLMEELIECKINTKTTTESLSAQRQTTKDLKRTLQIMKESNVRQALDYERKLNDLRLSKGSPLPFEEVSGSADSTKSISHKTISQPLHPVTNGKDKDNNNQAASHESHSMAWRIQKSGTLPTSLEHHNDMKKSPLEPPPAHTSMANPISGRSTPTHTINTQSSGPPPHFSSHSMVSPPLTAAGSGLLPKDVFERLANLHTQASQAKVIHRSGSLEDSSTHPT